MLVKKSVDSKQVLTVTRRPCPRNLYQTAGVSTSRSGPQEPQSIKGDDPIVLPDEVDPSSISVVAGVHASLNVCGLTIVGNKQAPARIDRIRHFARRLIVTRNRL